MFQDDTILRKIDEVRLLESRKSARLVNSDTDFSKLVSTTIKLLPQSPMTFLVSISPIFHEQPFRTKVFCPAFMCLQFGFVIFWEKDFGAKARNKTLVKLTPGSSLWNSTFNLVLIRAYRGQHWKGQYFLCRKNVGNSRCVRLFITIE